MRINIMALGDVGQNLLLGLKLLGGREIDEIGIYDINKKQIERLEMEMGQISYPNSAEEEGRSLPKVIAIDEDDLLECDYLVFCATRGVPPLDSVGDVRMAQLESNGELVRELGSKIKSAIDMGIYKIDLLFLMSDPVDKLCNILLESSGLAPERIRGLGLGVMNARARYFAERDPRFARYLEEGRVFGPHGNGLIVANSIENYDDDISRELTELVVTANMKVRALGYKPFIAPAISSGAISILETLRGAWTYGSVYMENPFGAEGKSYFGMLSRRVGDEWEVEVNESSLPEAILARLRESFEREIN